MSELTHYIEKRKAIDAEFAEGFESGYRNFKIGVMLRQAREEVGITQEELARRLGTKKSAISRIENHAEDIRLSTLKRYAEALGKSLYVVIEGPNPGLQPTLPRCARSRG
jgi:transcriptional regulator with XRE-family HTH domain